MSHEMERLQTNSMEHDHSECTVFSILPPIKPAGALEATLRLQLAVSIMRCTRSALHTFTEISLRQ
jgi:hypothetical protein